MVTTLSANAKGNNIQETEKYNDSYIERENQDLTRVNIHLEAMYGGESRF